MIEHPAYIDLVRNPTPWSLKMRRNFSKVLRIPGKIAATGGKGIGGAANVQAYSVDRGKAQASVRSLETELYHLITQSRLISLRVALAEPNQIYEVFSQDEKTDPDTVNVVVIAEGESVQSLSAVQNILTEQIVATLEPQKILRNDLFTMLISYRGDEFPTDRSQIDSTTVSNRQSDFTDP